MITLLFSNEDMHHAVFLVLTTLYSRKKAPPCQHSACCSCCSGSWEAVTFSGNYSAFLLLMTHTVRSFMGGEFRSWDVCTSVFCTVASRNASKFEKSNWIYFRISLHINFESTMFSSIISLNNVICSISLFLQLLVFVYFISWPIFLLSYFPNIFFSPSFDFIVWKRFHRFVFLQYRISYSLHPRF